MTFFIMNPTDRMFLTVYCRIIGFIKIDRPTAITCRPYIFFFLQIMIYAKYLLTQQDLLHGICFFTRSITMI